MNETSKTEKNIRVSFWHVLSYTALIISIVSGLNGWFVLPIRVDRLEQSEREHKEQIGTLKDLTTRIDERLALLMQGKFFSIHTQPSPQNP